MQRNSWLACLICLILLSLTSCSLRLQGKTKLAPAFQHLYLQTADPYGYLGRNLKASLKMSHVHLTESPANADLTLLISKDFTGQRLLSVNSTTQTRQYEITVTVEFSLLDSKGVTILGPEALAQSRVLTIQSNQILGSSNELNLYYQQMRRLLANAIMNRISSRQVTAIVNKHGLKKS